MRLDPPPDDAHRATARAAIDAFRESFGVREALACRPMTADEPTRASRCLDRDFRWRGTDASRMEALAAAVFALVLAHLFLQTTAPTNFRELRAALKALVPFALTFTLLAMVWVDQHRYFRRYGLIDKATSFGNLVLVGLVLFLAYPLKFLFTFLSVGVLGPIGELSAKPMALGMHELGATKLMPVYSLGFGAIYATFVLLYRHALGRAGELGLDAVEWHMTPTRSSAASCCSASRSRRSRWRRSAW